MNGAHWVLIGRSRPMTDGEAIVIIITLAISALAIFLIWYANKTDKGDIGWKSHQSVNKKK